jgi:TonB family protein
VATDHGTFQTPAPESALRFTFSVGIAAVIVFVLLVVCLWAFGAYDRAAEGPRSQRIDLLSESERLDLAEMLGEETGPQRPKLPELKDIPPLVLPSVPKTGFVQVEVVVDAQGRVTEAEVVGSTHEGAFEEQALAIVRARQYVPRPDGGTDRRTEIVDFTVEGESPDVE